MKIFGHISLSTFYTDRKILLVPLEMFVFLSGKFAFLNLSSVSRRELVTTFLLLNTHKRIQIISLYSCSSNWRKMGFIWNPSFLRILEFRFQRCLVESSRYIDEGTESHKEIQ